MQKVAVFHKIGEPTEDKFTHSIEQILNFDGVITFDGAYSSIYEYKEELRNRDIILFVQGNTVGAEDIMNWRQINELGKYFGFHIGWHGHTHRKLTELPDHAVIAELTAPDGLVPMYAYPHGDWDERVAKLVKQMGYLRAYSTTQGEEGNDFAIPRMYI